MNFRVHARSRHGLGRPRLAPPQRVTFEDDATELEPPRTYAIDHVDERPTEDIVLVTTTDGAELVLMMDDYVAMMIDCANRYHVTLAAMHPEGMRLALAGNDVPVLFRAS